jgi:predicted nucleic acid-binding protein
MYLLGRDSRGPRRLAEFIQATGVHIFESTQSLQLLAGADLMEKYADTPMDFADATLVLLSEEINTGEIFTLDRKGFTSYRTRKGKAFRIIPARS